MKVAMVRVGIDTGSGSIHGPLYEDGTFEYIPIPDDYWGVDERTYGNTRGQHGLLFSEYFPSYKQSRVSNLSLHFDPEFETFTYGDPTSPKARLRDLEEGDLLIFHCGLEGWDFRAEPALYLIGYFEVLAAGYATDFSQQAIHELFAANFHVRHPVVFENDRDHLVLVKGSDSSRLLDKAVLMSELGQDRIGRPLKVLSQSMQEIFGDFGGKISFQRSPTRWVHDRHVEAAANFMRSPK